MANQSRATELIADPGEALARVREIYDRHTAYLRDAFQRFAAGEELPGRVRACYPVVRVSTQTATRTDTRLSYGFVAGPGRYETTLTRPDLFGDYYAEQFRLLRKNHHVPLEIGISQVPIPVHFAFPEDIHAEGDLRSGATASIGRLLRPARSRDDGRQHRQRHSSNRDQGSRCPWRCSRRCAWISRSIDSSTTQPLRPTSSKTTCCSPTISSTSTSSWRWVAS